MPMIEDKAHSYAGAERVDADVAILDEIRELAAKLSDECSRRIFRKAADVVALNPQPLPPVTQDPYLSMIDTAALSPRPLPPQPRGHAAPS
jgi:hypothetical protein